MPLLYSIIILLLDVNINGLTFDGGSDNYYFIIKLWKCPCSLNELLKRNFYLFNSARDIKNLKLSITLVKILNLHM